MYQKVKESLKLFEEFQGPNRVESTNASAADESSI